MINAGGEGERERGKDGERGEDRWVVRERGTT